MPLPQCNCTAADWYWQLLRSICVATGERGRKATSDQQAANDSTQCVSIPFPADNSVNNVRTAPTTEVPALECVVGNCHEVIV